MLIETQTTPNPAVLKFLPGQPVMEGGKRAQFDSPQDAQNSPLAARLFEIEGVCGVFFGEDFISVTKGAFDWPQIKPDILGAIMDHFTSGAPLLSETQNPETPHPQTPLSDNAREINAILESHVRPALARDGGDAVFVRYENGIVWLQLQGACAGCPSSEATLRQGIENLLRHYVPDVKEVRALLSQTP